MKRYGLVFKASFSKESGNDHEQCFLAEYNNDGSIEDASPIDDSDGIYTDLNPKELSLVEIVSLESIDGGEKVSLHDLKTITIHNREDPDKSKIQALVENGVFPELAQSIFDGEFVDE